MTATRRRQIAARAALLLLLAGGLTLGLSTRDSGAVPVPLPVYEIIATSGGHTASLANLPLGQPGAPHVPVPVDVDGDLLPDVTVALNLVEVLGALNNPPNLPAVLSPNLEIQRLLTSPLLGQSTPPLRIEVKLRMVDVGGSEPDTVIRFGYDTGPGGSIPPTFKATLGGLTELFNPLSAVVDTGWSAGRPISYDGPLRIVGGIQTGDTDVDLGFGFSPFPHRLELTYADDDAGQHLTYAHSSPGEVDLDAAIDLVDSDGELHVDARVDRLPAAIAVDIAEGGGDSGAITWAADSDGRRPDVGVHVESIGSGDDDEPLLADIDLESLPDTIAATWSLPDDGPVEVTFDAGGQGIGGVDVDVRNHAADAPGALPRYVPTEQQFLSVRQEAGPDDAVRSRISGRVERVRHVAFSDAEGVLAAEVAMGDGELPLEVSYDCRIGCSEDGTLRQADIHATVAPLPDEFAVSIVEASETDPLDEPMVITYDASQPTDVETELRLIGGGAPAGEVCGDLDTTCAELAVRDVPTHLEAEIAQQETDTESTMEVDVQLGAGPQPDLTGQVVLGPSEPDGRPTVADVTALGLPRRATIRMHETLDEQTGEPRLDEARFQSCFVGTVDDPCPQGSGIGLLEVEVRNHVDRPDGFPIAPTPDAPEYATVTQRTDDLALQARFTDLRRVDLVDSNSVLGLRTDVGNGLSPFALALDVQGAPLGDDVEVGEDADGDPIILDGATQDLAADALITNLPSSFSLCLRSPHTALVPTGESFTTTCEDHPFEEDDAEPMAIAFALDATAAVHGGFSRRVAGTDQATDLPHSEGVAGEVDIPELPRRLSAHILSPPPETEGETHAIVDSNQQIDELTLDVQSNVNDSVCLDPRLPARALCAHARVTNIPAGVELRYDPTSDDDNLELTTRAAGPFPPLVGVSVHDLSLTTVAPAALDPEDPDASPKQSALILSGEILDLPPSMHGTLVLPKDPDEPTAILVCSATEPCGADTALGDAIGSVSLDATNIVTADPTPLGDDDTSNDLPVQRLPLPDATDHVALYQRGEAFHASLELTGVRGAGYRTVQAASGRPGGTQLLSLDLDTDDAPVIRAFVDLDAGTSHLLADATLQGVPPATTMCVRGADLDEADNPSRPFSFCDLTPTPNEGAFQLVTTPGADTTGLDVDAFIRQSTGGDADVLASRVRLTDVPFRVQGTFPARGAGSLDVRGYDQADQPDGFAEIDAEVATFDLVSGVDGDGYSYWDAPFDRKEPPNADYRAPAPASGRQHLALVSTIDEVNARARVFGLQQLALRNGVCDDDAVDPGAVRFDTRADHPVYPEPLDPDEEDEVAESPYQCIRTVVQEGAGQPMDLFVQIEQPDHTLLSLDEAEITAVPAAMEVTIANGPNVSGSAERRALCPERGDVDADPDLELDPTCLPPLIRFDQEGPPAQILGRLRLGTAEDLQAAAGITPRGNELDQARFQDIHEHPAGTGLRAVIGLYGDEEDTHPGIIGRFRFDVPWSLQVERPVSESGVDPDGEWTDVRFRYVVRDAADHVVPSVGDMKVLLQKLDGGQLLVSGDGDAGLAVPGEVAVALYIRDNEQDGLTFLQLDGTVSTELSASAVLLNRTEPVIPPDLAAIFGIDPTPGIDRMAFQLLGVPSSGFTSFESPGFRTQVELIDHPMPTTFPVYGTPPPDDSCSTIDCERGTVKVNEVRAVLDFDPAGGIPEPARMVRAVVDTRDQTRAELRAYTSVDAPPGAAGDAEIDAQANLSIDPISFYVFKGIPFLGNLEIDIDLSLDAAVTIDNASRFMAGFNAVHVEAEHEGSGTQNAIGPIDLRPRTIFAGVQGPLNVTVAGVEYTGGLFGSQDGDPLPLWMPSCEAGPLLAGTLGSHFDGGLDEVAAAFLGLAGGGNNARVWDDDVSIVILPVLDDPITFAKYGLGDIVLDIVDPFLDSVACAATDVDLGSDLIDASTPSDPVGVNLRPVPPGIIEDIVVPDPPAPAPVLPDGELGPGTPPMCGTYSYGTLTVTGNITVAGAASDTCPAGQESSLRLSARDLIVAPGASIDASAIVGGDCTSTNYAFAAGRNPIEALGSSCEEYLADGAGAPHVQDGGASGSGVFNSPSPSYAGGSLFGLPAPGGGGTSEAGWRGGGDGGGLGGGVIALAAERMQVDGTLLANGGSGAPGSDCTGGGGGSGGSVTIDAPVVQFGADAEVRADGGDGGSGGGGGGSAGTVLVSGGILGQLEAVGTSVNGGSGGSDGGASGCFPGGDPQDVVFNAPEVHVEHDARTNLLALGEFWQTTSAPDDDDEDELPEQVAVQLPFTAAAAPLFDGIGGNAYAAGNDVGYQVVLCHADFPVDFTEFEDGLTRFMPSVDGVWLDEPCGLTDLDGPNGPLPPLPAYYDDRSVTDIPAGSGEVRAAEAMTIPFLGFNGYHGFFTRAFVTDVAGNDCFDQQPDALYDLQHCAPAEELPGWGEGAPELIIGVDNSGPEVSITPILPAAQIVDEDPSADPPPIGYTNSRIIRATVTADDVTDNVRLSGLAPGGVVCYADDALDNNTEDDLKRATPCDGSEVWEGVLTDGAHRALEVVGTDRLGNTRSARYNLGFDQQGPTVSIQQMPRVGLEELENGWYNISPNFRLFDYDDSGAGGSPPHPEGAFEYQIDDGQVHVCHLELVACLLDEQHLPGPGRHVIHYAGIDIAGNRSLDGHFFFDEVDTAFTQEVKVDADAPLSGAFAAPLTPPGANGWYDAQPWVGVVGFDLPVSGSGFGPIEGEVLADPTVPFLRYSVDGANPVDYVEPFPLGDGDHVVCTIARDVAGNPVGPPAETCTPDVIRVDTEPPTASLLSSPAASGSSGWYTAPVTIVAGASDGSGSGIDPALAPSGVFVSVDGGPYLPDPGPVELEEGEHVVRAYAVDVAGHRSQVVERVVRVDESHPVSKARTMPPAPARNGWYRTVPTVTLKATDGADNAGVADIRWCLGTGCTPSTTYVGPFPVPPGTTVVRWRALDASGAANHEPVQQLTLQVDVAPPTALATTPSPTLWSRLLAQLGLGPSAVSLRWTVGDDQSGPLRVRVVVFDTFGNAVRHLDAGTVDAPPGQTVNGVTTWDGRNDSLTGLVPLGTYHYRVVVTDEAGNVAESGESRPVVIQLL